MSDARDWMTREDLAVMLDVHADSISKAIRRAKTRQEQGLPPSPRALPLPDKYIGRTPVWWRSTINAHMRRQRASVGPWGQSVPTDI
jgi:hypothetical protein